MGDSEDTLLDESSPEDEERAEQEDVPAPAPTQPQELPQGAVYRVKIVYCSATEFCVAQPGAEFKAGDMVVVPTKYGNEIASRGLRDRRDPHNRETRVGHGPLPHSGERHSRGQGLQCVPGEDSDAIAGDEAGERALPP